MSAAPLEAKIVHKLPAALAAEIGRIIVAFAKLEYQLTMATAILLALNRVEARLVLKEPRLKERLDIIIDLFSIKHIELQTDTANLRETLEDAENRRNELAHGIWLRHPKTRALYLRLTRGNWPQPKHGYGKLKRAIYPESIPYDAKKCREVRALIEKALDLLEPLGAELDAARRALPERFRLPSPVLNPLGGHVPKRPPSRRPPSRG